jgi:hypothetical protein
MAFKMNENAGCFGKNITDVTREFAVQFEFHCAALADKIDI